MLQIAAWILPPPCCRSSVIRSRRSNQEREVVGHAEQAGRLAALIELTCPLIFRGMLKGKWFPSRLGELDRKLQNTKLAESSRVARRNFSSPNAR